MVNREIKFQISGKTFTAQFPNVGQIIDIESLKQALTRGKYGQMAASGIATAYYALDLVDAIAFFQITTPQLGRHLDIKDYTKMRPDQAEELVKAYRDTVRPWFDETMLELKRIAPIVEEEGNGAGASE